MLAARGMTGPSPVFEGVGGYFKAVTRKPFELAGARAAAGSRTRSWSAASSAFRSGSTRRPWSRRRSSCASKVGSAEDIAEIRIETVTTAIRLMAGDPDKWEPKTRETADHSMPYTVAVALIHGDVEEKHFGERYLRDPKIRALTRRVKVKATEEADRRMPDAMLCRMEIVDHRAARRHEAVVEYHSGHWKNPMSDAEVEAKFRKLAREVLDEAQTTGCSRRCGGSRAAGCGRSRPADQSG